MDRSVETTKPVEKMDRFAALLSTGSGVPLYNYRSHAGSAGTYGRPELNKVVL